MCPDVLRNSEGWRGVLRTHKDSEERKQTQEKAYTSTFWRGKDACDSPGRMSVQEANLAGAKLEDFLHKKDGCRAVQESHTCAGWKVMHATT